MLLTTTVKYKEELVTVIWCRKGRSEMSRRIRNKLNWNQLATLVGDLWEHMTGPVLNIHLLTLTLR